VIHVRRTNFLELTVELVDKLALEQRNGKPVVLADPDSLVQ
jgi:hypothetical protein